MTNDHVQPMGNLIADLLSPLLFTHHPLLFQFTRQVVVGETRGGRWMLPGKNKGKRTKSVTEGKKKLSVEEMA